MLYTITINQVFFFFINNMHNKIHINGVNNACVLFKNGTTTRRQQTTIHTVSHERRRHAREEVVARHH